MLNPRSKKKNLSLGRKVIEEKVILEEEELPKDNTQHKEETTITENTDSDKTEDPFTEEKIISDPIIENLFSEGPFTEEKIISDPFSEDPSNKIKTNLSPGNLPLGGKGGNKPFSPPEPPPPLKVGEKKEIDLVVDPEMTYFFIFGATTSGKSAMVSSLIYYLKALVNGQIKVIGDNSETHVRRGEFIMKEMFNNVRKGEFPHGTQTLDNDLVLPTEINLEFFPTDTSKYAMPFCFLEMAGEDLKQIEIKSDIEGGMLNPKIDAYLRHPDCNIAFICVVDPDSPEDSENLIDSFINYIDKDQVGRSAAPMLLSVNKWDKVKEEYDNSVDKYIEKNLPILNKKTTYTNREYAKVGFSVGDNHYKKGDLDYYTYNPQDAIKIFNWMYETATGYQLEDEIETSVFTKFKGFFKK
jgi:hypothetical protein